MKHLILLLALVAAVGCQPAATASEATVSDRLPSTIGGQPMSYRENAEADLADQRVFFDRAIAFVGGNPTTARVAIGQGPGGFTLTALVVPSADARRLVDPVVQDAGFSAFGRSQTEVGGKNVLVLARPGRTTDSIYVYAAGNMLVVISTSQPALAEQALRALP